MIKFLLFKWKKKYLFRHKYILGLENTNLNSNVTSPLKMNLLTILHCHLFIQ
jgi:hypothetical protein